VSGMWERSGTGSRTRIRVEPFGKLGSGQRRELEAEADRIGRFMGSDAELTVGPLR
jgi:hypothetical protein